MTVGYFSNVYIYYKEQFKIELKDNKLDLRWKSVCFLKAAKQKKCVAKKLMLKIEQGFVSIFVPGALKFYVNGTQAGATKNCGQLYFATGIEQLVT